MPGPDASAPLAVDRRLGGRYRLIAPIAHGGMAEVWEGYDEVLSRPVAVKVLLSHLATDGVVRERFRREAVAAARLKHTNVVAIYDTGIDGGVAYIVMELVRGQTLRHLLATHGALAVPVAVSITEQIADALAHAHRAGLVHRDIKPANVLLADEDGPLPRIEVTDFGIAKAVEGVGVDLTSTGMMLGTPKYLSPEQVEGREPDARADLYSLGVVFFEMLTGRPPFTGATEMAIALAHLRDAAPVPSACKAGIPPAVDVIVAHLLAKDPADRYPSADALRRALAEPGVRSNATGHGAGPLGARARVATEATRVESAIAGPVGSSPTRFAGDRTATQPPTAARHPAAAQLPTAAQQRTAAQPAGTVAQPAVRAGQPGSTVFQRAGRLEPAAVQPHTDQWPHAVPVPPDRTPPPVASPAARPGRPRRRRARRAGPGLVVATLVVAGAVVGAILLTRNPVAGSGPALTPLALVDAQVFVLSPRPPDDPAGARNVIDGNPATYWQTALYGSAHFGNLYPGIGLYVQLAATHTLSRLTAVAPKGGWSASTFVSRTLPSDRSGVGGWGSATDSQTASGTTTTFSLGGRTGSWVLLWLTSTGGPPYRTAIGEITVT